MRLDDVFKRFLSLGNNCEVGIVVEVASEGRINTGLFHAAGFLDAKQMINGINDGFAGMFDADQYAFVKPGGWPDFAVDCLRFGFRFHTGVKIDNPDHDAELQKIIAALRYRKRMLLESLSEGDKIFVYRSLAPFDDQTGRDLFQAIRRHGHGRLLFVHQDPAKRFGSVETLADGLFYGTIARLSNENPPVIDFAAWEKLARIILTETDRTLDPEVPVYPHGSVQVHRDHSARPMFYFSTDAEPGKVYLFEARVYLPQSLRATNISLAFLGWPSESWTPANLSTRDVWQKISVVARAPTTNSLLIPCLNTSEDTIGPVYTTDWTLRIIER